MFEAARWRITLGIVAVEGAVFTILVTVFFLVSLAQGIPNRTLLEFGYEMLLLVGIFSAIWALGFIAAIRGKAAGLKSIAVRSTIMALAFFTIPGLMVMMLILAPTTLFLLISAASKRVPAVR